MVHTLKVTLYLKLKNILQNLKKNCDSKKYKNIKFIITKKRHYLKSLKNFVPV